MAFSNEYNKHDSLDKVDEEFRHYQQWINRLITHNASRAPKKSDQSLLWTFNDSGVMKLYVKNSKDGTYDQI